MNDLGNLFKVQDKKGNIIDVDFRKQTPQEVDNYTNLAGWTYHEVFIRKDYETEKCFVQPGDIVVDAGANLGMFTVYAAMKGASRILSFEPEGKNFDCLTQNAPPQAELFPLGIMAEPGQWPLFVDVNPGGHSFFNYGQTKTGEKRFVECLSIPALFLVGKLRKIDFLKMDIEGAEIEVLTSLPDEYFMKIRNIAFEYHNMLFRGNSLIEVLRRLGKWYNWILKSNGYLSVICLWRRNNGRFEIN